MIVLQCDRGFERSIDRAQLEHAAGAVLNHQGQPEQVALTIVITGDAALHELNRTYLGVDAPTDVLSFPSGEIDPDSGIRYLGDILIALPTARRQARKAGHPLGSELQLLVVHGALHLLGHDHARAGEKKRMWAAQQAVLEQLGLGAIKIQE